MSAGGGKVERGLGAYRGTTSLTMGAGYSEENRGCLWGVPRYRLSDGDVGRFAVGKDLGEAQRGEASQRSGSLDRRILL